MSGVPIEILVPASVAIAGVARVLTQLIRWMAISIALRAVLRDTRPDERPPIVTALGTLVPDCHHEHSVSIRIQRSGSRTSGS